MDLRKARDLLEGLLSAADTLGGTGRVSDIRYNRISTILTEAIPGVVTHVSRAEILRLVELCVHYILIGDEDTLESISRLGLQFKEPENYIGPNNVKP